MIETVIHRFAANVPDPAIIAEAATLLRAGGLVAFPTETVYGLGANALDPVAIARIYAVKGRPAANPLIVHVTDATAARELCSEWPAVAERLAAAFWPGPLTLVLAKSEVVPSIVTAGGPTIAVRCPAHPVARALIAAAGVPVAAPSANRSGQLSPTRAEHVLAALGGAIEMILDGGPCDRGLESTVVDVRGPIVRVLRPGPITAVELEAVVGPVVHGSANEPGLISPGLLNRHYSPRTPLELAVSEDEADFLTRTYELAGLRVARLAFKSDASAAGVELFARLHELDGKGVHRIIAVLPPETDDWRAVRDRLTRAAAEES